MPRSMFLFSSVSTHYLTSEVAGHYFLEVLWDFHFISNFYNPVPLREVECIFNVHCIHRNNLSRPSSTSYHDDDSSGVPASVASSKLESYIPVDTYCICAEASVALLS